MGAPSVSAAQGSGLELDLQALEEEGRRSDLAGDSDDDATSIPALHFSSAMPGLANGGVNFNASASQQNPNPNLNEDEQILVKVEEFNLQQAVLRTKLRVKNNREEAIDFVSKVILMVFGLLPLELDLISTEFRQSYMIYPALSVDQLERLMKEIGDYERIKPDSEKFRQFWEAQRELC